jgi:DNA-binding Lrp family transcriptional regulator
MKIRRFSIDSRDREILRFMHGANRGVSGNQIAKKINISPPAIKPRLTKLENQGIIRPLSFGNKREWHNPRTNQKITTPSKVLWEINFVKKVGSDKIEVKKGKSFIKL